MGNDVEILDEEEEFLVQYEADENDPDELLFKWSLCCCSIYL